MARFKGNKLKKQEKRPRGGGFGFNKSRELKEFEGHAPDYEDRRRKPIIHHSMREEVFIMDHHSIKAPNQPASFEQLSRISMTQLTANKLDTTAKVVEETTEELGFFFDSTPSQSVENQSNPIKTTKSALLEPKSTRRNNTLDNYQKKKSKIIQDDSIYIDSDDMDDGLSISSSEDVSMLDSLAHWGNNAMFQEEPAGHKYHSDDEEDYAILMGTSMLDTCDPDQDVVDALNSDEEGHQPNEALSDDEINVPESMKHNYRGFVKQERNRIKKQAKQQQKKKKTDRAAESIKDTSKSGKKNMFDLILEDFIQKDHIKTYRLSNLTFHGRRIVVPKLAKMFNLDISIVKSNKSSVELIKTKKTARPAILKKLHIKKVATKRKDTRQEKIQIRDNANHGKQVAASSTPISSSNVGHRMLAAMGWKEGEAIGNNEDGIKEPVKVFMRANRRGLGA